MMSDFTAAWQWPQWAFAVWLFLTLLLDASQHGKERRVTAGEDKGDVERYNFGVSIMRSAMWLFILIAGGFFA